MNALERRVTDALHHYAEGLTMTDVDVDRLQRRLQDQIRPSRRGGWRAGWQWAVAACTVLALAVGGFVLWGDRDAPAPATGGLKLADLVGVWRVVDDPPTTTWWLWTFTADGRVSFTKSAKGWLDPEAESRPFRIQEGKVFITVDGCEESFTPDRSAEGRLTLVTAAVSSCAPESEMWELIRISPASVAGTQMRAEPSGPSVAVKDVDWLRGSWLLEGTGTILLVDRAAPDAAITYLLDDEGDVLGTPDQLGTVLFRPDGSVVFRNGAAGGPGCDIVFDQVVARYRTLYTRVATSSCMRFSGATDTWLSLN